MFQLRKGFEVDVTVQFLDDAGAPASVDGPPVWSLAATDVFTVIPAADGMTAVLQGTGAVIGAPDVLGVQADADLGAGFVPVTASEDLQLVSGQAAVAAFGFGEPRPIAVP
jgi:hypothetical protein